MAANKFHSTTACKAVVVLAIAAVAALLVSTGDQSSPLLDLPSFFPLAGPGFTIQQYSSLWLVGTDR
jgi:hypothetical protein